MVTKTELENIEWQDVKIQKDPFTIALERFGGIADKMATRMRTLDPRDEGSADSLFSSTSYYFPNAFAPSSSFETLYVNEIIMTKDSGEFSTIRVSFSCSQESWFADGLKVLMGEELEEVGWRSDNYTVFRIPVPEFPNTQGERLRFDIDLLFVRDKDINPYLLNVLREEFEGKSSDCK